MDDLFLETCRFLTAEEVLSASFALPVLLPFRAASLKLGRLLQVRRSDVFPELVLRGSVPAAVLAEVVECVSVMRRFGCAPAVVFHTPALAQTLPSSDGDWRLDCSAASIVGVTLALPFKRVRLTVDGPGDAADADAAVHRRAEPRVLQALSLITTCALTHLVLARCHLAPDHSTCLAGILAASPMLKVLDLSYNNLDNEAVQLLIRKGLLNRSLDTLDLSFNNVTHALLPALGSGLTCLNGENSNGLKVLRIAGLREAAKNATHTTDPYYHESIVEHYTSFAKNLASCTSLVELDIHQTFPRLGTALNRILPQTNIKRLHLGQTNVAYHNLEISPIPSLFQRLDPSFSGLTHLILSANTLPLQTIESLSMCLSTTAAASLTHLHLDATSLTDWFFTAHILPHFQNLSNLHTFSATHNKLSNDSLLHLSETMLENPCPKLEVLHLSQNQFYGRQAGQSFASILLSTCNSLRDLQIGYSPLSDCGIAALSDALPHCRLQTLGIEMCGFGDYGCFSLASAMALCESLRDLRVRDNFLGDGKGVCAFIRSCFSRSRLESLDLGGCFLGIDAAVSLAEVLLAQYAKSKLKKLELSRNAFKDLGVQILAPVLGQINGLRQVGFRRCELTESSRRHLVEMMTLNPGLQRVELEMNPGLIVGASFGLVSGDGHWRDALGMLEGVVLNRVK
ncbi:hypothetical protein BDR26DRAFT_1007202 [Obelidium mucronatum]|nr:hypothetical protein BDR26DRAFT_1007202 [Obelidium mucronatum]